MTAHADPTGRTEAKGLARAVAAAGVRWQRTRRRLSPNPGQTVGLFLNTPKAFTGYTLFAPKHNTVTYLMDNQGQVVHQWKSAYEPGQSAYLLPNGHLVRAGMLKVHRWHGRRRRRSHRGV